MRTPRFLRTRKLFRNQKGRERAQRFIVDIEERRPTDLPGSGPDFGDGRSWGAGPNGIPWVPQELHYEITDDQGHVHPVIPNGTGTTWVWAGGPWLRPAQTDVITPVPEGFLPDIPPDPDVPEREG